MEYASGGAIAPAGDPLAGHLEVEGLALARWHGGDVLGQGRDHLTGDVEKLEGEAERRGGSRLQVGRDDGDGGPPGAVGEEAEDGDLDREGIGPPHVRLRGVALS